ncbi:MAG: L-histidine N(alpha)-methyltransferase [Coleofasciculaceae cyanobacterium SM2_1_6]|nr:L-histidine N(alpha)-methyltransferase [Coleofasciculaceae cyanobacterium SM2_1_6]
MQNKSLIVLNNHHQERNDGSQDVIQGLTNTPKSIPCRFFYDDRGSQLFEKICDLPEYYPTRTEAWILNQYAPEIAQVTGSCTLVELGSGSSTKTRSLLDAYTKNINADYINSCDLKSCKYLPVDISDGILKTSVLQLQTQYSSFEICGLLGTYDQALSYLASSLDEPQMIFFLGSSIGNFNQQESDHFFDRISQTLKPGDYFLLGVDLQKSPEILEAAYNDRQGVTADFNLNMLAHLNWYFQGNFDLNLFQHQAIYNQAEAQIEMYLHCQQAHTVSLDILNLQIPFRSGESILTEISRKFDLQTLQSQLLAHRLQPLKVWTDPKNWFALILSQA